MWGRWEVGERDRREEIGRRGGKEADRNSWVAEKRGEQDDGDGEECGGGGTTNLSSGGGGLSGDPLG